MRLLFLSLLVILFCSPAVVAQNKITVSGYLIDGETGEKIIGARVFDPVLKAGSVSNNYGFYSLTIEADSVHLVCTYTGFDNWSAVFKAVNDTSLNINMMPISVQIEGVEITDKVRIEESSQMSSIEVPIQTIKSLPALLGEVDVIKVLQLLPGVRSGAEGSSGFYVRGGGPDQNLMLLDGVPVYNITHLFGFFSIFNADAINRVELIKGGFPARYGGRLSSVLDISMKEGNMKEFHGDASIGIIASKLTLEGPIIKDKTSFMISGRRTYLDLLARPLVLAATQGDQTTGYFFHDLNGKINHKFSDKDRLYLSMYYGRDRFYNNYKYEDSDPFSGVTYTSESRSKLGWGNEIAALRWNHIYSNRLFGNLTANYSRYRFFIGSRDETREKGPGVDDFEAFEIQYTSGIEDIGLRADFDYYPSPNHLIRFGGYGTAHTFSPGILAMKVTDPTSSTDTTAGSQDTRAIETAIYIEDDMKIGSRLKMNLGVHASAFIVNQKFYPSVQPRFSSRFLVTQQWAAKASFATMQQYVHLLTNNNIGLPTDLWVPATDRIPPQRSWQAAVGVARTLEKGGIELSAEAYYKEMYGLIEYKEGASFFGLESDWQEKVDTGRGWAYGAEVLLQKKEGKVTGWIGYTLSWTFRQFDQINNGEAFPFKYDRRHDLSFVLNYRPSDRMDFGLTWVFGTGQAATLPVANYISAGANSLGFYGYNHDIEYYTTRNGFRMRDYHRLDLGVNFHKQKKWYTRTWSFSAYNAYSRQNPFFIFWESDNFGLPQLKQLALFPIIPSVAFRMKF